MVLVVLAWVHYTEMHRIAKAPEEFLNDSTCNLGSSGNLKFNVCIGRCPTGKNLTFLRAFMAETKANFLFIFQCVCYIVYGDLMKLVINVVMDGNPHVHTAAQQALESGFFGTRGVTTIRNCFFHAVTQKFLKEYLSQLAGISLSVFNTDGFQKAIEAPSTDGGMGLLVYKWLKWMVYEVKTQEQCLASRSELIKFINGQKFSEKFTFMYPEEKLYGQVNKCALEKFVEEVFANFPRMCMCYNSSRLDFGTKTTSSVEGEFSATKSESRITSKTLPTTVVEHVTGLADRRELSKEVHGHKDANRVPSNLRNNENSLVLRVLTPLARDNLQKEIDASWDWSVTRVSPHEFLVQLSPEAIKKKSKSLPLPYPHLFNWDAKHEQCIITVEKDSKGVLRLYCSCFTCKSNTPCRRVIAIKGGRVHQVLQPHSPRYPRYSNPRYSNSPLQADVHFRYLCDYLNGMYTFITRKLDDLTGHQGATFTPSDDERHMIEVATSTTTTLDVVPTPEVHTVVFLDLFLFFARFRFF